MSISQRSTKAALYSEIERLRALLDGLNGQITMQAETIKRRGEENLALSAEIEGLTTMLQGRAQQTAARGDAYLELEYETQGLRSKVDELTSQLQGRARNTAARGDRATRMLITKRLAISLGSTVRWNDEYGFEYMNDGHWSVVPRHMLEFVMAGIQS